MSATVDCQSSAATFNRIHIVAGIIPRRISRREVNSRNVDFPRRSACAYIDVRLQPATAAIAFSSCCCFTARDGFAVVGAGNYRFVADGGASICKNLGNGSIGGGYAANRERKGKTQHRKKQHQNGCL